MGKRDYRGRAINSKSMVKFQCGTETIVEDAIKLKSTMKFQCGKEANCRNATKLKGMMKFQWERDKYSTALNIQKPSVDP